MVCLQGPVICPAVDSKQVGVYTLPFNGPFPRTRLHRSDIWGYRGIVDGKGKPRGISGHLKRRRRFNTTVQCIFSSSSDGNGSMAENFNENNEDYVNSSVVEAVEVRSGADGFMIKMRDGKHLRCVHNNPQGDGTGLLLPIIVLEMPSALLMAALRNVQIARPTMYQVVKNMIDKMGYTVKLVRVTKRVHEAYFAQLYLTKVGDETESVCFDLRPSDAINIAVRCKVPIQVNKYLAYSDGMRVIESGKLSTQSPASDGLLFTELDQPSGQHCLDTEEFNIVCDLNQAINQERYKDAGNILSLALPYLFSCSFRLERQARSVSSSKELEEIYVTVVPLATPIVNRNYCWKPIDSAGQWQHTVAKQSVRLYILCKYMYKYIHLRKMGCNMLD
ncbi:hypothetical protein GOBAR_AA37762 [Gossypium barbadense]|uniref:BFN domain-containing protein n=1 Tax=Gossypium barbadense TaxID=3634 RepID=A0A2P5VVU5_GOSBA|nr:hypothetical protein GOBAR_AA37762 [Gossypium barbadense]